MTTLLLGRVRKCPSIAVTNLCRAASLRIPTSLVAHNQRLHPPSTNWSTLPIVPRRHYPTESKDSEESSVISSFGSALQGLVPPAADTDSRPVKPGVLSDPDGSEVPKTADPLRILFCGSDDFSVASLRALNDLRKERPDLIKSIDVVVRPPKRAGRGLKEVRTPPLTGVAEELGLKLWVRDTFTGWRMPKADGEPINLIVAVSFGLWIPERLLSLVKYGGLNVHPSLLPEFRGAAPIHHTILHGNTHTGVSLQTLSTVDFDCGTVLLQHPQDPGVPIPAGVLCKDLLALLTPLAAEALVIGIRDHLFLQPQKNTWYKPRPLRVTISKADLKVREGHGATLANFSESWGRVDSKNRIRIAPKVEPIDSRILWTKAWSGEQLDCQWRMNEKLWTKCFARETASTPLSAPRDFSLESLTALVGLCITIPLNGTHLQHIRNDTAWIKDLATNTVHPFDIFKRLKRRQDIMDKRHTEVSVSEAREILTLVFQSVLAKEESPFQLFNNAYHTFNSESEIPPGLLERWISTGLETLELYFRVKREREEVPARILFDRPEILSKEDALLVRKKFNATDVGRTGMELDDENLRYTGHNSRVLGPRTIMKWIKWMDPVGLGLRAPVGGRKNRESKREKAARKARGVKKVDNQVMVDTKGVQAEMFGQVWLESSLVDDEEYTVLSENMGAVLIPTTRGEGVVRFKKLKKEGQDWKTAASVLQPHLSENWPPVTAGGPMAMFVEGVQIFKPPPHVVVDMLKQKEKELLYLDSLPPEQEEKAWHQGRNAREKREHAMSKAVVERVGNMRRIAAGGGRIMSGGGFVSDGKGAKGAKDGGLGGDGEEEWIEIGPPKEMPRMWMEKTQRTFKYGGKQKGAQKDAALFWRGRGGDGKGEMARREVKALEGAERKRGARDDDDERPAF